MGAKQTATPIALVLGILGLMVTMVQILSAAQPPQDDAWSRMPLPERDYTPKAKVLKPIALDGGGCG